MAEDTAADVSTISMSSKSNATSPAAANVTPSHRSTTRSNKSSVWEQLASPKVWKGAPPEVLLAETSKARVPLASFDSVMERLSTQEQAKRKKNLEAIEKAMYWQETEHKTLSREAQRRHAERLGLAEVQKREHVLGSLRSKYLFEPTSRPLPLEDVQVSAQRLYSTYKTTQKKLQKLEEKFGFRPAPQRTLTADQVVALNSRLCKAKSAPGPENPLFYATHGR
eukprot:NODE_5888_length_899_cov_141.264175_g5660_i0.p1 GENE.NODE_5888_length_899_cov_141.264175_g5660_i0~~NODE_5888_length_899_cov_141.264175_g5660_i0.p1  ORF type:complete len:224 (+),score=28.39 NODE_5888_length_899_cov_141.264175_g5660_i0:124-795(+)